MKFPLRLAALLLALLLLGGSLLGCAAVYKPLNYAKSALEKTLDRRFGGEMADVLLETIKNGSLELNYGGTDLAQTPLQAAQLKLWFNEDVKRIAAVGSATVGEKVYDGKVFLSDNELVLSSVAFFGSNDLGVNFNTLSKDLQNSIFRNNTAFAHPDIDDRTGDDVKKLKNAFFTFYGSVGDVLQLSDELADDFLRILTEHATPTRYAQDGKVYISVKVDNTVLSRTLRDTRKKVISDRGFCRELRELAETRDAVLSVRQGTRVTEWGDKVENFIASDLSIEGICTKIDELTPFQLTADVRVGRMSGLIETATVNLVNGGQQVFDCALDLSAEDTNVIRVTYGEDTRILTYRVLEDGFRYYDAQITYEKKNAEGEVTVSANATLNADRSEDVFSLTLVKGEETRVFGGSFDKKIDGFEVAVKTVKINETDHRFALSLRIKSRDTVPDMPAYTNLAAINREDLFEPIYNRIKTAQKEFLQGWGTYEISPHNVLCFFLSVVGMEEEIPIPPKE